MHLAYIWIVSHLSAKNYQNWCKFNEVLTKTNPLSFLGHGVVHKSLVAQQVVRDCGFLQLNDTAYSPDLSPNDCYLFGNLKSHLCGPGLQTMNRYKLLLKRGLKDRTENSFFKA